MYIFTFALILSAFFCWVIIKTSKWHAKFTLDSQTGAQKFHKMPTPRIGGLAIFLSAWSLAIAGLVMHKLWAVFFIKILAPTSLVFLIGFAEDIYKKIPPLHRLMVVTAGCIIGIYSVHVINTITHTDVIIIDYLLRFEPISIFLTVFIILGVTNSFNIIDGYNGLCITTAISTLLASLFIAYIANYHYLDNTILILLGAIIGLSFWNYPHGKIFLGDGGAYLLGFIGSLILLELSQKVPGYSPFTSLLIMIYPISETLLSIYRKKFLRGKSPFQPDRLHMHMVIYSRLIRHDIHNRNAAVVIKMLWFILPQLAIALLFYKSQIIITFAIAGYIAIYFWLYFRIISFKSHILIKYQQNVTK